MVERDRAMANALNTINANYRARLSTLLPRAQQVNDADTVARLNTALSKMAAPLAPVADATARAPYVGSWLSSFDADLIEGKPGGLQELNLDGSASANGKRFGSWDLQGNRVSIHFDEHRDWGDFYDGPIQNGILHGKNIFGAAMTFTRAGILPGTKPVLASSIGTVKPDFLGVWEARIFTRDPRFNRQWTLEFLEDGTWLADGKRIGPWTVKDDYLNLRFYEHAELLDRYPLPIRDGELQGKNLLGDKLILRRRAATGAALPVAAPH